MFYLQIGFVFFFQIGNFVTFKLTYFFFSFVSVTVQLMYIMFITLYRSDC